jgi:hypothetical protein
VCGPWTLAAAVDVQHEHATIIPGYAGGSPKDVENLFGINNLEKLHR